MTMKTEALKKYGKLLIAFLILYFLVYHFAFRQSAGKVNPLVPLVVAEKPKVINMADYVKQTGNTVAFNSVDLVARIEGYLQSISYTDGAIVDKGAELFVIEPEPYKEKLKEAQASVKAAQASLEYSQAEYARQQRMFRQNATSKNSVEVWLAKMQQAEAELAQAKANLINAEINYSYTHVHAPFNGRMGRHLVDIGNLVGNGQATKLATIEQIRPIYVYFNLNELDLLKLREAAKKQGITEKNLDEIPIDVGLQDEQGYPHHGHLNYVNTGLNASTGTMEFRGLLENKELTFLPGLFVKVRIPITPERPLLTVPSSAVLYDQIGPYLITVNEDKTAVLKRVSLGPAEQGRQAISKGITKDDLVIINGLQFATPGKPVRLEPPKEQSL